MSDQRQIGPSQCGPLPAPAAGDAPAAAERLAASRDELDRIYASADAILDQIGLANSARFLEQVRQSGGQ